MLRQGVLKHLHDLFDQRKQIHRASFGGRLAAEGQQLLDQIRSAISQFRYGGDVLICSGIRLEVIQRQFRVSHDAGQQIVEVVGNPCPQLPYRHQSLMLLDTFLRAPLLGSVTSNMHNVLNGAVFALDRVGEDL